MITTTLYAGLLALMFIWLSVQVIKGRRGAGVAIGDQNILDLQRRVRAQGNFAEYAPFFVVMAALAESNGLPPYAIHGLGVAFIAGRAMHAFSLLSAESYTNGKLAGNPVWRIRGMICTFSVIGILAGALLVQYAIAMVNA